MKLTNEAAAVVKGMLKRGDKHQWIVAAFGGWLNPGRIAEIANGEKFAEVLPAAYLPPRGPYPGLPELVQLLGRSEDDD